ncbi:MAG: hypothetical protein E6Q78_09250 [Rhodoferax sp.]|nr:MAG: hypothetical protein E6Q78_09250 [Rhodoferax sp.]
MRARSEKAPTFYDTILWLQAGSSKRRFPVAEFSGDTDMVAEGWVSLTSIDGPEIIVTRFTGTEFRSTFDGVDGYLQLEQRVNCLLGRSDLRCTWLTGSEKTDESTRIVFPDEVIRPRLLYRDILSSEGVAFEVDRTTRSVFEAHGGKVTVVN